MRQQIVDEAGRVRLAPHVKEWMREHLSRPFYEDTVWREAKIFGFEAERNNPNVCPHCVAGHLYDVLERAHRMKEAASGT
jgi:hypothetical protein